MTLVAPDDDIRRLPPPKHFARLAAAQNFRVQGRDGTDSGAPARRQAARAAHIKNTDDNLAHVKMAAATLDEAGQMNGSVMIVDFPDRAALDAWLATEPYVTGQVWARVTITPCRIGPSFRPTTA